MDIAYLGHRFGCSVCFMLISRSSRGLRAVQIQDRGEASSERMALYSYLVGIFDVFIGRAVSKLYPKTIFGYGGSSTIVLGDVSSLLYYATSQASNSRSSEFLVFAFSFHVFFLGLDNRYIGFLDGRYAIRLGAASMRGTRGVVAFSQYEVVSRGSMGVLWKYTSFVFGFGYLTGLFLNSHRLRFFFRVFFGTRGLDFPGIRCFDFLKL